MQGQAEMMLFERADWPDDDPRWRWLRDFAVLIDTAVSLVAQERQDDDAAWFLHATGALTRLVPVLADAFDVDANHMRHEAHETAIAELERITSSLRERQRANENRRAEGSAGAAGPVGVSLRPRKRRIYASRARGGEQHH
jgi:hypothetical protein